MDIPVCGYTWVKTSKGIVCALSDYNAICLIRDEQVEYLYSTEYSPLYKNQFIKAFTYEKKVIFVPYRYDGILVLHIDEGVWHRIDIDITYNRRRKETLFSNAFMCGNRIYMFGDSFPGVTILEVDREECKTYYISDLDKGITDGRIFTFGSAIFDDIAYVPIGDSGSLLEIDMNNDLIKIKELPIGIEGIGAMTRWEEEIVMIGYRKDAYVLVRWNPSKDNLYKYSLFESVDENIPVVFLPPIIISNKAYVFPYIGDHSYTVDLEQENENMENKEFDMSFIGGMNRRNKLLFLTKAEDNQIIINFSDSRFICLDVLSNKTCWEKKYTLYSSEFSNLLMKHEISKRIQDNKRLYEDEKINDNNINIRFFLQNI